MNLLVHKVLGNSWVADWLAASQAQVVSIELQLPAKQCNGYVWVLFCAGPLCRPECCMTTTPLWIWRSSKVHFGLTKVRMLGRRRQW
jgi:hypothetical protein